MWYFNTDRGCYGQFKCSYILVGTSKERKVYFSLLELMFTYIGTNNRPRFMHVICGLLS